MTVSENSVRPARAIYRRRRVLLALAALVIAAYVPAIIALTVGSWPFTDDAIGLMGVWRGYARESLWQGTLPLWNPYLFCGLPFMSNGQSAVLYPPNIIYWTLPVQLALLVDAIGHNIFLAFGAYVLARALRLSRTAAFVTAMAVALGGAVGAHINVGHMTWHAARAYIPWELWALLMYLRSGDRRYAVVLAALFGLQSLAGYPPMLLLGLALCIGLLIAWTTLRLWRRRRTSDTTIVLPRGWVGAALATAILAALLSAVSFLPLRETSQLSPHGAGLSFESAVKGSGNWHSLVRLAIPEFFGGSRGLQWSLELNAHEEAAYIGLLTLVLAVGAPYFARRRRPDDAGWYLPAAVRWLWALLPFVALLAMGDNTPFYGWLYEHSGLLRLTRVPVRWLEVWALCAALLAGFAFEGSIRRARQVAPEPANVGKRAHPLLLVMCAAALLLLAVLVALAMASPQSPFWLETAQWNIQNNTNPVRRLATAFRLHSMAVQETAITLVLCLIFAGILAKWRQADNSRRRSQLTTGLVAAIALDLLVVFWRSATPTTPRQLEQLALWPAALAQTYTKGDRWDTGVGWSTINRGMPFHVELYNGYDALGSARYFQFAGAVEGKEFWTDSYQVENYSALLRVAGLTHTISTVTEPNRGFRRPQLEAQVANWKLWRHEGAWPRSYVTRQLVRENPDTQLAKLTALAGRGFDESGKPAVVGADNFTSIKYSTLTSADSVVQTPGSANMATFAATASAPSLLVHSETLSPGWRAWVNGRPAELLPANFLFRGVAIPAEKSQVAIVYDTQTYRFGIFLTLCGVSALCAIVFACFRRKPA